MATGADASIRDYRNGNVVNDGISRHTEACPICLEEVTERAIAVPCNHAAFDFLCLVSWVQDHPTCPLCKTALSAIEYDWAGPNDYKTFLVPLKTQQNAKAPLTQVRSVQTRRRQPRSRVNRCESLPTSPRYEQEAIERRKRVYQDHLYSRHVGANRVSQFRDFTPQTFTRNKEFQRRARQWMQRELQVFDFLNEPDEGRNDALSARRHPGNLTNIQFVIEYIVSVLKTSDIYDSSGKTEEMVAEFLGSQNARLFLHELNGFLRSPYTDLHSWDQHVQY